MEKIYSVSLDFINTRIDRWIRRKICLVPQSLIEKNLRNKNITVNKNKVKSSYKLNAEDKIYLNNFNPKNNILGRKNNPIVSKDDIKKSSEFIVEDNENFCVINKPSGLAVQGGTKVKKNLIDIISKNKIFRDEKPFIVHRIDKDTSGILIIAKNRKYAQLFTSLFRIRKIYKTYLTICSGAVEKSKQTLINDLTRIDNGKKIIEKAITQSIVLDKNTNASFLKLNPITGRKHQLRKQLSILGNPIFGDDKYSYLNNKNYHDKQLFLHAYSIKFMIDNKKFTYTVDIPEYFKKKLKSKKLNLPKKF